MTLIVKILRGVMEVPPARGGERFSPLIGRQVTRSDPHRVRREPVRRHADRYLQYEWSHARYEARPDREHEAIP
jgi:hypothetical protein